MTRRPHFTTPLLLLALLAGAEGSGGVDEAGNLMILPRVVLSLRLGPR